MYIDFEKDSTFEYEDTDKRQKHQDLKAYDTKNKTWRHFNFFEHACYLHARVPRVKLPNGKTKFIKIPWEGLSNGFTLLFEVLLLQLCQAMPVNKVAHITQTSDDKLWSMLERYIEDAKTYENFENVEAIKTMKAYNIRQSFQEIYTAFTQEEFITYLNKWYYWATYSKLDPIIKAAKDCKETLGWNSKMA